MTQATDTPTDSGTPKRSAAGDALGRYAGLIVGVASLLGLLAIGYVLWPTSLGVGTPQPYLQDGDLRGIPAPPPGSFAGRNDARAGDVIASLRGDGLTFRYADTRRRWDTTPELIGAADAERVGVFTRLRRDRGLRERVGVSFEQLQPAIDAGRGNALNVPDAQAQAVRRAMAGGDRDAIWSAVAAAGNAARADFLARTDAALAALREVVTDDVVARVRASGDAPPAPAAADAANEPADAK